jgi:hypothetical protein
MRTIMVDKRLTKNETKTRRMIVGKRKGKGKFLAASGVFVTSSGECRRVPHPQQCKQCPRASKVLLWAAFEFEIRTTLRRLMGWKECKLFSYLALIIITKLLHSTQKSALIADLSAVPGGASYTRTREIATSN